MPPATRRRARGLSVDGDGDRVRARGMTSGTGRSVGEGEGLRDGWSSVLDGLGPRNFSSGFSAGQILFPI